MVPTISSNLYISIVRISTIGSGIRSGHAGVRLGTGAIIPICGIAGIAARWRIIGTAATIGTTIILIARSAMHRIRVLLMVRCAAL